MSTSAENLLEKNCVGAYRINYGSWYVPKGKISGECTICQFCVNNNCIDLNDYIKLDEPVGNCNCDCPYQNNHPHLKGLKCPVCHAKSLDMGSCNQVKGECKICHSWIPDVDYSYCNKCSIEFQSCYECGEKIKNGNEYLEMIKNIIEERVSMIRGNKRSVEIKHFYNEVQNFYKNKTEKEMIQIVNKN